MIGWIKTTLGAETDLQTGLPFKSSDFTDAEDDIRLLRGDNIIQGDIRWADVKRWPKSDLGNCRDYLLSEGDVVLAMDRPWIEAGLKQAVLNADDIPCLQVQRTARLRGKGNLATEYLRYIVAGTPFTRYIKSVNTGSGVPHISANQIRAFPVTLPPKREQIAIASVLSALDAKIELNNAINAELEGMAKLLYDYWFVQFDFPLTAAQAASLGRPELEGHPYKSSGGPMVHNPTLNRLIPTGWTAGNIFRISELGGGGTPTKERSDYWSGHIPFFTPTDASPVPFLLNTEAHITDAGLQNSSTRLFTAGSLFLTARGSVGKVMITACEMAMSQSCYALIPHKGISSQFLYFQTLGLMGYLKAKSSGSIFKSIVTSDIEYSPTIIAPRELIAEFSSRTDAMFEQIRDNLRQNQELTALRDWLLPMLMNGQVTVG